MKKTLAILAIAVFALAQPFAAVETKAPEAAEASGESSAESQADVAISAIEGALAEEDALAIEGNDYPGKIPACDLELPENALIDRFIAQYTTPDGIKYLTAVIKRSGLYREFIMAEIERQEVPECLFYLPVIESGFSTSAVSRSGATGLWQFMRNSVSGYGIRINDWMDERKDPWITTAAAIRKLKENYADLGDWNLALAAYNCGLGATRRAVKKAGTNDYWELCEKGYFKKETMYYVPKFLAISSILSKSKDYGIDWGETESIDALTTIPVKRPVDINVLAKEAGIDAATLKSSNPALYYHITPPDATYSLRVPTERKTEVEAVLADKSKMLLEYYLYKIKSGDTLFALALHYGISVDMIKQYNPGLKPSALKIGAKVVIPALKEVGTYHGKQDPDTLDFSGVYTVKKGDTLWSIALAYNIQVETLAEKNNMDVNGTLSLGKTLRVPIL